LLFKISIKSLTGNSKH